MKAMHTAWLSVVICLILGGMLLTGLVAGIATAAPSHPIPLPAIHLPLRAPCPDGGPDDC